MSTVSHPLPGKPSFGGLLARIFFIVLLWAALVTGTLHYVGYAWPKAYQIHLAEKEEADQKAMTALNPPAPANPTTAPAAAPATAATTTTAAPAAPAGTAAPAAPATSATPAPAAAPATGSAATASATAAPAPAAASAPKAASGEPALPHDLRLAGYNRTALGNVSIFFSIVISAFCVGSIILQIFKYKQMDA